MLPLTAGIPAAGMFSDIDPWGEKVFKKNSLPANPAVCLTTLLQKELWVVDLSCSVSEQVFSSHISDQVDSGEEN